MVDYRLASGLRTLDKIHIGIRAGERIAHAEYRVNAGAPALLDKRQNGLVFLTDGRGEGILVQRQVVGIFVGDDNSAVSVADVAALRHDDRFTHKGFVCNGRRVFLARKYLETAESDNENKAVNSKECYQYQCATVCFGIYSHSSESFLVFCSITFLADCLISSVRKAFFYAFSSGRRCHEVTDEVSTYAC